MPFMKSVSRKNVRFFIQKFMDAELVRQVEELTALLSTFRRGPLKEK